MPTKKKYSGKQIVLIGLLGAIALSTIALVFTLIFDRRSVPEVKKTPLAIQATSAPVTVKRTAVPPPTQRATITPGISNSATPENPAVTATAALTCSSPEITTQNELHAYYLKSIEKHYNGLASYYQGMLNAATQVKNTLRMQQAQNSLTELDKQKAAEIESENARYNTAVPEECR